MIPSENIQQAFLCLIRAGLWNRMPDDCSFFPLSETEWKEVWNQAVRQSVRGLLYQGVCLLPEELLPPQQLVMYWLVDIEQLEHRNRRMNKALTELTQGMRKLGVHPVVLKGQGVAQFYEHPLWRECGDIDLYFADVQEERKVVEWVRSQGGKVSTEPDGAHVYRFRGIEIEHHLRALDLYAGGVQQFLKQKMQQHGRISMEIGTEKEQCIEVLAPTVNLLSLNAHILKHFMGHGIGLRQFCDLARAYHALQLDYKGEELKACYKRCGIARWSRVLHAFLVQQLGLPVQELPYEEAQLPSSEPLLQRVMEDGNFGMYTTERNVTTSSVWRRKLNTAASFLRHLRFSMNYAPQEAFSLIGKLIFGNIKS